MIVFPELANTGYVVERDKEFGKRLLERAEKIPGPFTETLGAAAREHGAHLIFGLCERHPAIPGTLYNSAVMVGPDGSIAGVHRKIHIFAEEKHYFAPGNKIDVHKTDLGNIGMLVCYDAIFPEISRVLAVRGAEIICCIFNRAKREPEDMLPHMSFARAYENRVFFVSCDRVGKEPVLYMGRSKGGRKGGRSSDTSVIVLIIPPPSRGL